jgi:hypothetical protein
VTTFSPLVIARASARSNLINAAIDDGIASSAFGLLAMTNGELFKVSNYVIVLELRRFMTGKRIRDETPLDLNGKKG